MALAGEAVVGVAPDGDDGEACHDGAVEQPQMHQRLRRHVRRGLDIGATRPFDEVEAQAAEKRAEAGGGLGGERHGAEEDALLAHTGLVFVLVRHVRHHRAERHEGELQNEALDEFEDEQDGEQGVLAVLWQPAEQPQHDRKHLADGPHRGAEDHPRALAGGAQQRHHQEHAEQQAQHRAHVQPQHLLARQLPEVLVHVEVEGAVDAGHDVHHQHAEKQPHERPVGEAGDEIQPKLRQHVALRLRRRFGEVAHFLLGADRRIPDGGHHQHAQHDGERRVVGDFGAPAPLFGEEVAEADDRDGGHADRGEELPERDDAIALVVVLRHLRAERQMRHVVERHGTAGEDGEHRQPGEEPPLAQGLDVARRPQQADEGERQRHRRGVHEGMAPPEARLPVVRQRPGERIRHRVEQQGDHQRQAGQRAGQFQHLVVVEQHEDGEGRVLQALGELPHAECELARKRDESVAGGRRSHAASI